MFAPAFRRLDPAKRKTFGKALAFFLTWLSYTVITSGRLAFSISKDALRPEDDAGNPVPGQGWAPFNEGTNGKLQLGNMDAFFMGGYTIGMPLMGLVADRLNYAYFLAFGMVGCSACFMLFGAGYEWGIHNLAFYFSITFACGVFQSIAYPCVNASMSNWFGKSRIGRTMGVWSSCSPTGNVVGKLVCTACLVHWGPVRWSPVFYGPALITVCSSIFIAFFLFPDPHGIGILRPGEARALGLVGTASAHSAPSASAASEEFIPLGTVLRIPSLVAYSVATTFAKLVYYAFLFWLPFYLTAGIGFSRDAAGYLSTLFDMGGFVGGIVGGWLSDKVGSRGLVCCTLQLLACPMMLMYLVLGKSIGVAGNIIALFFVGACVSTPYNLITSVAAVDLGVHPLLKGNSKAKATVTGIIDGCGSLGAAVGSPLVGFISSYGWTPVFVCLIGASLVSGSVMIGPTRRELRDRRQRVSDGIGVSLARGECPESPTLQYPEAKDAAREADRAREEDRVLPRSLH